MVAAPIQKKRYSLEEYFEMEEKSEEKHEFHNGKIILMPGGSVPHNKIAVNITSILNNWIEANNLPYYVLNSDTKVRIEHFNRNVYPDVLVVCEKPKYWKGRTDIIVNPTIVFEVFSNSTPEYDRDGKFNLYRSLPTFKEYVLVDQFKPLVDDYFKQPDSDDLWKITTKFGMEESIHLHSIGFDLLLSKIYWQVPELQGEDWES